jgi:hypothetical protein
MNAKEEIYRLLIESLKPQTTWLMRSQPQEINRYLDRCLGISGVTVSRVFTASVCYTGWGGFVQHASILDFHSIYCRKAP